MMRGVEQEKRMLVDCAAEGHVLIGDLLQQADVKRFFAHSPVPGFKLKVRDIKEYLNSNNPDIFYAALSVLCATEDSSVVSDVLARKIGDVLTKNKVPANHTRALNFIEGALYHESEFERELVESISRYASCSDEEISAAFLDRFEIVPLDVMSLPNDCSVYFAKANHGLWEFIRGAYDAKRDDHREKYRGLSDGHVSREVRTSGLAQMWGWQINRYFMHGDVKAHCGVTKLCVSLTAGAEAPTKSIRKGLDQVTRGAAVGLLSMFETAVPGVRKYQLGDGSATRSLITGKQIEEFFVKYVSDSEACLFVVPQHLKMIDFINYKGDVHKLVVPPTKVNITWKAVAATFVGYLKRLADEYRTITILAQGAAVASSLALLVSEMDFGDTRIRFFDLGRVLDVTTPETLQRQAWAKRFQEDFIEEGSKVFCLSENADFVLATNIS